MRESRNLGAPESRPIRSCESLVSLGKMLRVVLLAVLAAATRAESCTPLAIDATQPINVVEEFFTTWNIDSSRNRGFFDIDFSNAQIDYLASQIGGSRIRFGGTGNDALYYGVGSAAPCKPTDPTIYECLNATWWANLVTLSNSASAPIVLGLNIHPNGTVSPPAGPWDPSNAAALLTYAQEQGQAASIWGLELGNEQNSESMWCSRSSEQLQRWSILLSPRAAVSAAQQAAALHVLAALLDQKWVSSSPRPVLLGPDTHSFHDGNLKNNGPVLKYIQVRGCRERHA